MVSSQTSEKIRNCQYLIDITPIWTQFHVEYSKLHLNHYLLRARIEFIIFLYRGMYCICQIEMILSLTLFVFGASQVFGESLDQAFRDAARGCSVELRAPGPAVRARQALFDTEHNTVLISINQGKTQRECLARWAREHNLTVVFASEL